MQGSLSEGEIDFVSGQVVSCYENKKDQLGKRGMVGCQQGIPKIVGHLETMWKPRVVENTSNL